jgi:hypothetical protein
MASNSGTRQSGKKAVSLAAAAQRIRTSANNGDRQQRTSADREGGSRHVAQHICLLTVSMSLLQVRLQLLQPLPSILQCLQILAERQSDLQTVSARQPSSQGTRLTNCSPIGQCASL